MHNLYVPATAHVDMTVPDAIEQILAIHKSIFGGFRMEEDGDDDGDGAGDDAGQEGPNGFPENTPIKDMTTEQQVAYWRHQSRKHEARAAAAADYDAIKAERDQLKQSTMTDAEKAIEEAKTAAADEARADERSKHRADLVRSKLEAALARRQLPDEQITTIVGPLDTAYFLTESGEVDADKVTNYAAGFGSGGQWPDTGQGKRGSNASAKGVDAGRDLYRDRTKK